MPLMTEIVKGNGHRLQLRWGWWHVEMMKRAAGINSVFDWPAEGYVMPHDWSCCDPGDREVLTFKKGWRLEMWRSI